MENVHCDAKPVLQKEVIDLQNLYSWFENPLAYYSVSSKGCQHNEIHQENTKTKIKKMVGACLRYEGGGHKENISKGTTDPRVGFILPK